MKKKNSVLGWFLAFFLLSVSYVFGQETTEKEFKALENKIYQVGIDKEKAFQLSKFYLKKAKETKIVINISNGYVLCGIYAPTTVDKVKYSDSLITFSVKTKDNRFIGFAYKGASRNYLKLNDYKKSLEYALIAYEYSKNEESKEYSKNTELLIADIKFLLKNYDEAKQMYADVRAYYEWKHVSKSTKENKAFYILSTLGLIKTNAALKDFDSNQVLFSKLTELFKTYKDIQEYQPDFTSAVGFNDYMQGKYDSAIEKFNSALSQYKDQEQHLYEKFYLGMSYWKLQESEKALPYFNEILEDYEKTGRISMEFRPMFEFYIDYEKSKGDRDKQLKAVDRLLDYDRTFATEQKDLSIQIKKDYDNQRLLDEKAQLENDIQKERRIFAVVLGLLAISLVIGLFYFFKRKKEKRQLAENPEQKIDEIPVEKEEIAHDLINLDSENSTEEIAEENQVEELTEVETPKEVAEELQEKKDEEENVIVRPTAEESQEPKEPDYSEYLPIGKETAIQILKKLDQFEKRKKYLKGNLRLSKLATEMNTNDKYLARVIKVKTGKIFNFYINDLRFDYLQKLIDEDPNFFKKKKIKDLSKHLGLSSPEFFTNLFKERYGVSPKEYFNDAFFENRTPRSEEQNG